MNFIFFFDDQFLFYFDTFPFILQIFDCNIIWSPTFDGFPCKSIPFTVSVLTFDVFKQNELSINTLLRNKKKSNSDFAATYFFFTKWRNAASFFKTQHPSPFEWFALNLSERHAVRINSLFDQYVSLNECMKSACECQLALHKYSQSLHHLIGDTWHCEPFDKSNSQIYV